MVIFFESQIRNPQGDRNSANEIVQELTLERMTVQYLVLHAQVPSAKNRKEGNGKPRRKHAVTHHSKHRQPVHSNNYGKCSPLTDFLQHGGCR